MFGKKLLFYFVASTIIAVVASLLGADLVITFFASMVGPSVILLVLAIMRYNR